MVGPCRLELQTSSVSRKRSNQLSYGPFAEKSVWKTIISLCAGLSCRGRKVQMTFDFTGKTAVVTGGANGIGLATARALAAGGADLWIFDLERERPADVASTLGGRGAV